MKDDIWEARDFRKKWTPCPMFPGKLFRGVRKNSESEWELPKRSGLVANRNDIRGNVI